MIKSILSIVDKITDRFTWDKKVIRRNEVREIERKINELLKTYNPKNANRIMYLRKRLSKLREKAINDA